MKSNDFGFILIILSCKSISEYLSYRIGLVPSLFYAHLDEPVILLTVMRELIQLILLASGAKSVTVFFVNWLECSLQERYTTIIIHRLATSPKTARISGDVEQRIMDDAKNRAQLECQLCDKVLLPFLIVAYSIRCWMVIPYQFALPVIYGFAAVSIVVVRWAVRWMGRLLGEQDQCEGIAKSTLCQIMSKWDSVRMAGLQEYLLNRSFLDSQFELNMKATRKLAVAKTIVDGIRTLSSYGGALVNYAIITAFTTQQQGNSVSASQLSQHSFLCLTLIYQLDQLVEAVEIWTRRRVYVNRMTVISKYHHYEYERMEELVGGIEFDNVCVNHLNWRLSFNTATARVTWIVGPNGSGKTTIVKLIIGLLLPDSGKVKCDRDSIFVIPQGPLILDFTALDLTDSERAKWSLRKVGLNIKPHTPGEWQRLHLARLLYHQPRLAVLDEPTSHMDNEQLLLEIVSLLPNTTFIILTPNRRQIVDTSPQTIITLPAKSNEHPTRS